MCVKESMHVIFDETNIISERQEQDDEENGLTRNSNGETAIQLEAVSQEITGDGPDLDEPGSSVDQNMYRGMIDSLLYLTARKPNSIFSVGLCTRFQTNPKESHLKAVKRILRYLKGTTDFCLWCPKGSSFDLVGYADADYVDFLMD
ncbi:secreted RxLR effector protein 161-like [Nicotiana tomentosiformis]|uniref:secreted RxLR effector protein 161-like n=1 Tax=Nicotiana tomentosiformis TaxID=4098 RepID=UPI00388C8EE9